MAEAVIPVVMRDENPTLVVCPGCDGGIWKVHRVATNVCQCGARNVLLCLHCDFWCCAGCNEGPADA